MKKIDTALLDELTRKAQSVPRRRANHNLHDDHAEPAQRLLIAMEPDTYIRPHRHPQTWELLTSMRGRFVVLLFDDAGAVTRRMVLGEDTLIAEYPAHTWHAVLSLDSGGVVFETKLGPYMPITEADSAPWSKAGEGAEIADMLAWYAKAQVGDRFGV